MEVQKEMSDNETRDVVDKVERALQEKVSDESAKPERFIVNCNEEHIHSAYIAAKYLITMYYCMTILPIVIQRM